MWTAFSVAASAWFAKVDWARIIGICLIPLALWLLIAGIYMAGERSGRAQVQAKWDVATNAQQRQLNLVQGELNQRKADFDQKTATINDQLKKAQDQHEEAVAALSTEHALRMRQSSDRAAVYQRDAEAGGDLARGLASHASGLDQSLEEGRGLVAELQAALGQREAQLRLLGDQIVSDRKLVDGQ